MSGDIVVDGLPYPVIIADDAAHTLPKLIAGAFTTAVVAYDRKVESRAKAIATALRESGVTVLKLSALAAGERAKRASTIGTLYDDWLEARADRRTGVFAVGGGTVTDVSGFAAATFLRGVPWVAVPTTVLGMADASIGGKTGINLPQGKNLVGAFWDPCAVISDVASLATLPPDQRATGLAEAVKCAIIGDVALLEILEGFSLRASPKDWKPVVAGAARIKARIAAADPHERGERSVLNLGHTVGHAIETASAYAVSHGEAVSVGLRAAGLIARARGWWPLEEHARVLRALRHAGLPLAAGRVKIDPVMKALSFDKKSANGRIRFVLPVRLGEVRFGQEVPAPEVRAAIETCLAEPSAAELNH